jgi:hypothetical protein
MLSRVWIKKPLVLGCISCSIIQLSSCAHVFVQYMHDRSQLCHHGDLILPIWIFGLKQNHAAPLGFKHQVQRLI